MPIGIAEMQIDRQRLEFAILELLRTFESKHGVAVTSIDFKRSDEMGTLHGSVYAVRTMVVL